MKLYFKFKIAMLSFAVSGALLTTFGVALFAFIYSSGIDRVDRELRSLVEAPLRGDHPVGYWKQFGESIKFIQGEGGRENIALIALDRDDRVLFQSENARPRFARIPLPAAPESTNEGRERASDLFLARNDRDGDGKVARDEFDGPNFVFNSNDGDNDGYIDAAEASQMRLPPPQRRDQPRGERLPPTANNRKGPPPPTTSKFTTLNLPFENWRVGIFRSPEITLIAALDMDSFNAEVNQFRYAFMIAVPLGLLVLGFMGWYLADRAMKPVAVIADTVEHISAKGLDKRVPMVGNDIELERLVTVSNDMLDRLEKSYHQAVRFSADAAHELQTPLTILQGELDNAIQDSEDGSTEQQRYGMLLEELRELKSVVQKLLLLAHADEGRLNINRRPVDLSDLIENAAEDIEIMAPELTIETRLENGVTISGDAGLLNQTLRNMTSNAAKYATANGRAVFTLDREENEVRFTLANSAPPIPDADQPLLFERFHRVERSRTAQGSGLGLSLAREIARAHGGDLTLAPYADGMVSFILRLPMD